MLQIILSISALAATSLGSTGIDESMALTLIKKLHPGIKAEVSTINPEGTRVQGTITLPEGSDVRFMLTSVPLKSPDSQRWTVFRFTRLEPAWNQEDLEAYLAGGPKPEVATIKDAVLMLDTADSNTIHCYVPDAEAIWNKIEHVEAGDLIGDGSLLILVESEALYAADDPREFIGPGIHRLLRVPDFVEIFSAFKHKIIIGPSAERTFEILPRTFRIVPPKTGTVNDIVQISHKGEEEARFIWQGEMYQQVLQQPAMRSEEELEKRQKQRVLAAEEKVLSIIVVNEDGEPIPGARIDGTWNSSHGWMSTRSQVGSFTGSTNTAGEFSQTTPSSIAITIRASGYEPVSRAWGPGQVPTEPVIVTLQPAPQAVPMFEWDRGASWWKVRQDQFNFGVTIAPAPPTKTNVNEDRESSDLWFEVTTANPTDPSEIAQSSDDESTQARRNWDMTIYALRGWEMALGPSEPTGERNDPKMRIAPDSGYVSELHFESTENLSLFLHHSPSDRYGMAYRLAFSDLSFPGIASYGFRVAGLVQEETSGTRSLNPMSYEERHGLIPTEQTPSNPSTATHDAVRSDYAAVEAESTLGDSPGATPTTDVDLEQQPSQKLTQTAQESSEEILNKAPRPRVATYIAVGGVAIIVLFGIILTYRLKRG